MEKRYAKIISTGRYLPERVMTNAEFEPLVGGMLMLGLKKMWVLQNAVWLIMKQPAICVPLPLVKP